MILHHGEQARIAAGRVVIRCIPGLTGNLPVDIFPGSVYNGNKLINETCEQEEYTSGRHIQRAVDAESTAMARIWNGLARANRTHGSCVSRGDGSFTRYNETMYLRTWAEAAATGFFRWVANRVVPQEFVLLSQFYWDEGFLFFNAFGS